MKLGEIAPVGLAKRNPPSGAFACGSCESGLAGVNHCGADSQGSAARTMGPAGLLRPDKAGRSQSVPAAAGMEAGAGAGASASPRRSGKR